MEQNNELESEIEASNKLNIGNATSGDKRRVVVAPHRNLPREQKNDDWRSKKTGRKISFISKTGNGKE